MTCVVGLGQEKDAGSRCAGVGRSVGERTSKYDTFRLGRTLAKARVNHGSSAALALVWGVLARKNLVRAGGEAKNPVSGHT